MSEISILNGYKIKDKKAVRYYDTISNMKSDTTLKAGMYVKTKGYYSVNDGGESEYYITSVESQTEYQEELSNNLYATLVIGDVTNIKQFGARGNEYDDTIPIQTAINKVSVKGGTVLIPEDTFYVRTIEIKSNVILKGYGNNSIIKGYANATAEENRIIKGFSTDNNWKVENLFIDVNSDARTQITESDLGITVNGSSNVEIKNVKITGNTGTNSYSLRVGNHDGNRANNVFIHDCEIIVPTGGFNGIAVTSGKDITIENNIITNTEGTGACIDIETNQTEDLTRDEYLINNIYVLNNKCYGSNIAVLGKTNPGNSNITVENNYIELTSQTEGEAIKLFQIKDVNVINNSIVYNKSNANNTSTANTVMRINGQNLYIRDNNINIKSICYSVFRPYGIENVIQTEGTKNVVIENNFVNTNNNSMNDIVHDQSNDLVIFRNNTILGEELKYGIWSNSADNTNSDIIIENNKFQVKGRGIYTSHKNNITIKDNIIECYRNKIESSINVEIINNIIKLTTSSYDLFETNLFENTTVIYENNIIYGYTADNFMPKPYMTSGTQVPNNGYFVKGSIIWNSNPSSGNPIGWVCTVSGTPGTWVAMVNL